MAENWDWSDLQEDEEQEPKKVDKNDPKSLRQFATKTAKENEELRKQIAEITAAARVRGIAEKLAEKKIPEKVAKLIPAEVTADKLDDWLKEYEDLWSANTSSAEGQEQAEQDDGMQEVLDRMGQATAATVPASRPNDLIAQVKDPTLTRDQLLGLIERSGGGYGVG